MRKVALMTDSNMDEEIMKLLLGKIEQVEIISNKEKTKITSLIINDYSMNYILVSIHNLTKKKENIITYLKKIKEIRPEVKIILSIGDYEENSLKKICAIGAIPVSKKSNLSKLKECLNSVFTKGDFIDPLLREDIVKIRKEQRRVKSLSQREVEVIQEVKKGKKNKEIAKDLFIAERTVVNHITSINKKLNLSNRSSIAVYPVEDFI